MKITLIDGAVANCARPLAITDYLHPSVVTLLYGKQAIADRFEASVVKCKVRFDKLSENRSLPAGYEPTNLAKVFFTSLRAIHRNEELYEGADFLFIFCTDQALNQLSVAPDVDRTRFQRQGFDVLFSCKHLGKTECFVRASSYFVAMDQDLDWYCMYE